jgi:hypothetical protein
MEAPRLPGIVDRPDYRGPDLPTTREERACRSAASPRSEWVSLAVVLLPGALRTSPTGLAPGSTADSSPPQICDRGLAADRSTILRARGRLPRSNRTEEVLLGPPGHHPARRDQRGCSAGRLASESPADVRLGRLSCLS